MRLPSPLIRSGEANNAVGNAVLAPSRYNLARLIVNFDSTPSFGKSTNDFFLLTISVLMIHVSPLCIVQASTPNYNVIETDYDNFAIVYTCSDKFGLAKSGQQRGLQTC